MPNVTKMALGLMLTVCTSTAALAQAGTPLVISDFRPIEFVVKKDTPTKDTLTYISYVHGLLLRDITFTDSAAIKGLALQQAEELWTKAGKDWYAVRQDPNATAEQRMERQRASQKVYVELLNKLLPELRPLIPDAQQVAFDRNLKALRESDYVLMAVGQHDTIPGVDTVQTYLVLCDSRRGPCTD